MAIKKPDWNKCVLFLAPDKTGAMKDFSGRGNDAMQATAANQPALVNDGINGLPSLDFDGIASPNEDFLTITNHADLQFGATDPFTILTFFKCDTGETANGAYVFSNRLNYDQGYIIHISGGSVIFLIEDDNGVAVQTSTAITDNIWCLVGGTRNIVDDKIYIHINGNQKNSANDTTTTTLTQTVNDLVVGKRFGAAGQNEFLNGNIQYVLLFSYALSDDEHEYLNDYLRNLLLIPSQTDRVLNLELGTSAQWTDTGGHDNHGLQATPGDQPTILSDGTIFNAGLCYDFDGASEFFKLTDNIDGSSGITITGWFNLDGPAADDQVLSAYNTITGDRISIELMCSFPDDLRMSYYDGATTKSLSFSNPISKKWHFYAFVWDGTELYAYLDDRLPDGVAAPESTSNEGFFVACRQDGVNFFDGKQVGIKVWKTALTATEIASLYKFEKDFLDK